MSNKAIYLLSSNASKEYISDVLEVLSLPFGMAQHFRYQLKWINEELKKNLPIKENSPKNPYRNNKVVICYLYQEKKDNSWEWVKIYPVRTGILMDAYKTGEKDEDIAHFYFIVDRYLNCDEVDNLVNNIKEECDSWGKDYAFCEENLKGNIIASKEESYSAFYKVCHFLKNEHFRSPKRDKIYYPFFYFIEGLQAYKRGWKFWERDKKSISPKFDSLSHKSYYEISEGSFYTFGFRTHFTQNPPEHQVTIRSDEKVFSTPSKYEFKIMSPYTEESCILISKLLKRDIWTIISYKIKLKESHGEDTLNTSLDFPIKVKRKWIYRLIDTFSEIGFGVGTGAIALKAAFGSDSMTWWYWPTVIGYTIWGICKMVTNFWRG